MTPLILLPTLLLFSCQHQYLAIPGAEPVTDYHINVNEAAPAPAWSVSAGDLPGAADESATITLQLDPTWPFSVEEIVVTVWITATLSYAEYWVYELSDEEKEAGEVDMEVMLTSTPPGEEICSRSVSRSRTCYGPVDEGIVTTGWLASTGDGGDASMGAPIPISLPPLQAHTGGHDACDDVDVDALCAGQPEGGNFSIEPPCECPDGTTWIGTSPEGWATCLCP